MERVVDALKRKGMKINEQLLSHLSPPGWEHINLTGDYIWKSNRIPASGKFRRLRPAKVGRSKNDLLAKNVFAVHGVDQHGKTVLVKPKVSRAALPELIASLPPCVIGMEACSGAHYWARLFRQYGHEPRLMAAKFVSPYRMAGKSGKKE